MQSPYEAIKGLEPQSVWRAFADISRIPRGSKNEAAIAKHVMDAAASVGLSARQDRVGNVLVKKPAAIGREGQRSVCLQGHLDMVCEKNKDKDFDFSKDPIELVCRGNLLCANGTTLGGDNGIAVATELAVMRDPTLQHGPLELLFTIDEEAGMTGAMNLEPGFVESRILLNLDSEEDGALYVGCSGGKDTTGDFCLDLEPVPAGGIFASLAVKQLRGGHSGLDIDKRRGNSLKILAQLCASLEEFGTRLDLLNGGNKRNAIPREAEALVWLPGASSFAEADRRVQSLAEAIRGSLGDADPDLRVSLERVGDRRAPSLLTAAHQRRLLAVVDALPHGVLAMSADIADLVQTSTNVASMVMRHDAHVARVTLATSQRSSVPRELTQICNVVRGCLESAGATVTQGDGYPGWQPNLKSEILSIAKRSYRELYGKDPEIKAIHAGLECGIIGERYPGMDMISFGPTLEAVHSPDECIHIDTVGRYWDFLLRLLANVS